MKTRRIHMVASMPHYARHVRAVWRRLPEEIRGECVEGATATARRLPATDVVMVGGFYDIWTAGDRDVVYVEHGAGQSYRGDPSAKHATNYPGGSHPRNVVAYIAPSQRVADAWPAPAFAAGCPAVDVVVPRGHTLSYTERRAYVTFHFDARQVCPEARSAREHYEDQIHVMISRLQNENYKVWGHAHPKDPQTRKMWANLGVPFEEDVDQLLRMAALVVADNTSVLYEAALLDIPTIVLNAPWYRRDVHHGLRFWEAVPGAMVDDIWEFASLDFTEALITLAAARRRRDAARYAYAGPADRHSGERAARWLIETLGVG